MSPDDRVARADDEMLEELRALRWRAEPAPPRAVAAAEAAFKWRSVALAIAGLEFDSVVDEDDDERLARVRDDVAERRLRFAGAGRSVEVALVDNNRRLAGRVDPPLPGSVVLLRPDGATSTAPLDANGQFFFDEVGRGPVRFRPVPTGGTLGVFETEWVTL